MQMNDDVRRGAVLLEEQLHHQFVILRIAMAPCNKVGLIQNDYIRIHGFQSRGVSFSQAQIAEMKTKSSRCHVGLTSALLLVMASQKHLGKLILSPVSI